MSSGAKRNRDISDFSGRLRFLAALGMTLGLDEIFNTQAHIDRPSYWGQTNAMVASIHPSPVLRLLVTPADCYADI